MKNRALLGAALLVGVLLAGCSGSEGEKAGLTSAPPTAAEPVAGDSRSALTGLVVSEELIPIVGATVALRETDARMESDATGRFTFNDLDEGTYTLLVGALGFQTRALKATTQMGKVTHVNVTLALIALPEEAIITSASLSGFVDFGHAWTDYYVAWGKGATCTKCVLYVGLAPNPKDVRFEASWVKPIDAPTISHEIYYLLKKDWQNGSVEFQDGTVLVSGYWVHGAMPRNLETGDNTTMFASSKMKNVDRIKVWIGGGFTSVAYQQRIDMWISFVYNGAFPDDFSAFPKE